MTNVEMNTVDYEFSHGHKPRGTGRWAFFFQRRADVGTVFWVDGTYANAKKAAKKEARRRNVSVVYVGS